MVSIESKMPPWRLKFNGIFDFDGLYKVMYNWFNGMSFYFEEGLYKHKVPTPAGAEQDIEWSGWRKITEYTKYWIRLYIKLYDMKEIIVIKDGQKKKLTKARLMIEFYPSVELDYQARFSKENRLALQLQDFYHKFIIKKNIQNIWEDQIWYYTLKLYTIIKEYMDFEAKGNVFYDMW